MLSRRFFLSGAAAFQRPADSTADVVIYGGTPAGLAAAVAAVRTGATAVVIEPTTHIGGMVTGGIAITDTGTPDHIGGLAREYFEAVAALEPRPDPAPAVMRFRGGTIPFRAPRRWDIEPKYARQVFDAWVTKYRLPVRTALTATSVQKSGASIRSLRLSDGSEVTGRIFLEASYEGDLMARAGVSWTYGRESQAQYGESLAGVRTPHFVKNYPEEFYRTPGVEYMHHGQFGADIPARDAKGRLWWGVDARQGGAVGGADRRVQAYCFRLIATQREDLRVAWPKPRRYFPQRYELLLRYIQAHPDISFARLVHFGPLPNGKWDFNASGPFSIDYIGGNYGYPAAGYSERRRMYLDHLDYQQGFLWFLAHDPRVPAGLREEVTGWGLCRDEYPDTGHWPVQLYIRESRRMTGRHVMTEHDILSRKTKEDSVAMGNFVLDSHWVQRFADPAGFVRVEGHLDESIGLSRAPYEIPYRSITPRKEECSNLLVPVCVSATHVAICTIRMEPVYMMLGEAAGVAAALALESDKAVQEIDTSALLTKLAAQGGILNRKQVKLP